MADANSLSIKIQVDASQLTSGMSAATATVTSASDKMAAALSQVSPASLAMASSLQKAGMSAADASSAMKNLGFSAADTTAALQQVGLALNETGPAGDVAARGVNNARSAMMGLNRELGLGGNRALSTFIAQSETLGPILSNAFTGIAIVGFIQLAVMLADKLSRLISDTFIFTDAQKALYGVLVAGNQKQIQQLEERQRLMRDLAVVGLPLAQQEAMRAKWAREDAAGIKERIALAEKDVQTAVQKLNVLEQQKASLAGQTVNMGRAGIRPADQGQFDEAIKKQEDELAGLNETLRNLREQYKNAGLGAEGLTKKSVVEALKEHQKELEKSARSAEEYAAKMEHLNKELERAARESEKIAEEETQFFQKETAKQSENELKSMSERLTADEKFHQDRLKDAENEAIAAIAIREKHVQEELSLGQITNQQALEQLNALASEKLAVELKYLDDRAAVVQSRLLTDDAKAYAKDLAEWSKLLSDKLKAQEQYNLTVVTNTNKAASAAAKGWQAAEQGIQHAFDSTIRAMVQGHMTFTRAVTQEFNRMISNILSGMARWLEQWIINMAIGKAVHKATQQDEVLTNAKGAAAGAFRSVMDALPFPVNAILAPPAAAAAFVAVEAFSAEGGWNMVPKDDTLALLHKNEMVLPAPIADYVRAGASGGATGSSGDIHIHYSPQISAIDARGMKEALAGHADTIAALLRQHQREFKA